MRKKLSKVILASFLIGTSLLGSSLEHTSDSQSLVGLELGYSSVGVENDATPVYRNLHKLGDVGFKVGVQSDEYRLFIGGRYYGSPNFKYMNTIGAEFQYLFNFSKYANFYLGVNTGLASLKIIDEKDLSRTISDNYFGGDAGFNIHLGKMVDLELGARLMSLQAENTRSSIKYTFDNIISGYASVIIKYDMN